MGTFCIHGARLLVRLAAAEVAGLGAGSAAGLHGPGVFGALGAPYARPEMTEHWNHVNLGIDRPLGAPTVREALQDLPGANDPMNSEPAAGGLRGLYAPPRGSSSSGVRARRASYALSRNQSCAVRARPFPQAPQIKDIAIIGLRGEPRHAASVTVQNMLSLGLTLYIVQ